MENQEPRGDKIRVEDLTVIFGKNPHGEALSLLKEGHSKDDILEKTGHIVGVANASFSVKAGEIFVVMGLSGSGKSTLIRGLNRLINPTSGKVLVDGENVLEADKKHLREIRRTKMAMVFQHFALLPHKSVIDNVAYGLRIRGVEDQERHEIALEALDMVGLKQYANKRPDNLSGGMKQRVGLARALATDADILLMDEAFGALDPLIRRQMQNELMQLQERLQKTVVFITHDLNEALRVGNHVAIMRAGKIVQIGNPVEIITQPADDYVAAFMQDVDQSRVLTAEVVMQPADYVVLGHNAVQTAIERAKAKDDASAFFVVDGQRKLEGLISKQNLLKAHQGKQKSYEQYIERDLVTAPHSTTLTDLYAMVSNGLPVAVTDAENRLMGVVSANDVLSSLASVEQVAESVDASAVAGVGSSKNENEEEANGSGTSEELQETVEAGSSDTTAQEEK
jgi:glycine betaine/proline transport system ATP-binding protein